MDLLGDIGFSDQLTAARSENAMLKQRVQELTARVRILEMEKASLQVEVEQYRQERMNSLPNISALALGKDNTSENKTNNNDASNTMMMMMMMKSGDGVFCKVPAVILSSSSNDVTTMMSTSNRLCACLDSTDRILATGYADGTLQLQFWGETTTDSSTTSTVVRFPAPVITCRFDRDDLLAIGCMDGACMVAQIYTTNNNNNNDGKSRIVLKCTPPLKPRHEKYVKNVCFQEQQQQQQPPILATSSADGNIHFYKIDRSNTDKDDAMMMMTDDGDDEQQAHYHAPKVTHLHSLHFHAPVEAMVFAKSKLICHVRNSPHLYVIDDTSWELQNVDIHEGKNGGFENHVSFCVLDLQLSPNGQFLACATDAHRHIILDGNDYRIVRNLYGHQADNYSSPVIAWSTNSQYLYSNHQHEAKIVVYELASGKIVSELMAAAASQQQQQHTRPIKALYSSKSSNTLVSISWDRSTIIWFTE